MDDDGDGRDMVRDKEVTRKDLGLEWMLRSVISTRDDCQRSQMEEEPQEPKAQEVSHSC